MYIKFSPVSRFIDFLPLLHILTDATHLLLSCFQFIDVRSKSPVGLNKEECFFVHHLKLRSVAKMKVSCWILLSSIIGQSLTHLRLLLLLLLLFSCFLSPRFVFFYLYYYLSQPAVNFFGFISISIIKSLLFLILSWLILFSL